MTEQEIWKPIHGYEGRYEVSNYGQVRSYQQHRFNTILPHILKSVETRKGYLQVCLTKNGKQHSCFVHRIVAETFLPKPDDKQQINHIDLNKKNNHVKNLEWCNGQENIRHARRNGIIFNRKAAAVISKPVRCVELNKIFNSAREAARQLNLSFVCIGKVCLGRSKTTGGYHFEFAKQNDIRMIKPADVVYISGPMSGKPLFNYPAFYGFAGLIEKEYQCKVLNPARQPNGLTYDQYIELALKDLAQADVVVFLDGWQNSNGAVIEINEARKQKKRILFQRDITLDLNEKMNQVPA